MRQYTPFLSLAFLQRFPWSGPPHPELEKDRKFRPTRRPWSMTRCVRRFARERGGNLPEARRDVHGEVTRRHRRTARRPRRAPWSFASSVRVVLHPSQPVVLWQKERFPCSSTTSKNGQAGSG